MVSGNATGKGQRASLATTLKRGKLQAIKSFLTCFKALPDPPVVAHGSYRLPSLPHLQS